MPIVNVAPPSASSRWMRGDSSGASPVAEKHQNETVSPSKSLTRPYRARVFSIACQSPPVADLHVSRRESGGMRKCSESRGILPSTRSIALGAVTVPSLRQ